MFQKDVVFTHSKLRMFFHRTLVTFSQLQQCKTDGIVSPITILKSYWDQAELIHGTLEESAGLIPNFRFAVRFAALGDLLIENKHTSSNDDKKKDKTICSEPVMCAGIQYRVLLCREDDKNGANVNSPAVADDEDSEVSIVALDSAASEPSSPAIRALLQRTRSPGASSVSLAKSAISYSIYAFDKASFMKGKRNDSSFFEPITVCDFSGGGYAKSISLPFSEDRKKQKECNLWMMVVIKFK
jgi:hypothetical protein